MVIIFACILTFFKYASCKNHLNSIDNSEDIISNEDGCDGDDSDIDDSG